MVLVSRELRRLDCLVNHYKAEHQMQDEVHRTTQSTHGGATISLFVGIDDRASEKALVSMRR